MARTLDQWVADTARSLRQVPEDVRGAAARQLVRGVQELQRFAPRRQGPKLKRTPSLYRSIKMDRQGLSVYTDHPGAQLLEYGGRVTPKRGKFLLVPLKRSFLASGRQFFTLPERNGVRVVVEQRPGKRRLGPPAALLLRRVFIRARRWVSRAVETAERGAVERIASQVLAAEQREG